VEAALPGQSRSAGPVPADRPLLDLPAERPGPCLPGWTGGLTALGAAGLAGFLLWRAGVLPAGPTGWAPLPHSPRSGTGGALWAGLTLLGAVAAFAALGLTRGRPGVVRVLSRCGAYRGSVRRTGLLWVSPLLSRQRVDVSVRHWRSRPIDAVDAKGTPLRLSVLLVWRVRDTAKAVYGVDDHGSFLREVVEAAVARAVARHPADDFRGDGPTLRDCERVGDELARLITADVRVIGLEIFSATPVRVEYAPEVAAAMRRSRMAALDARRRKAVLDDVLAAVAETVRGISERGLGQLDEYERKSLVRDLTVEFLRSGG
jgi:regulator of protease activity HflC (stomatin/prohibitin superfamily)